MKSSGRQYLFLAALIAGALVFTAPAMASQVAKVTSFDGDVVILQGKQVTKVTRMGQAVMAGDRIQTQQGTVQITFEDGAVMKVNEFTTAMVQEREEESGFAFWKKKETVRRITAFVGKLWFKSGASEKKNFLQTPTAVCGLRGTDGEIGYDNLNSYLNMYSGQAEVVGNVVRGVFNNPGVSAATQNAVYQALQNAANAMAAAGDNPVALAQAKAQAAEVVKQAAEALKENPDATVSQTDGELASAVADAEIAAAEADIDVAEIDATIAAAEAAGTSEGQTAAAEAAAAKETAAAAAATAATAAAAANTAAATGDLAGAKAAATQAQTAQQTANQAKNSAKTAAQTAGVTTTVAPTTVATTSATTAAATTAATTAAATTVRPTTTSTSTSSTTSAVTTTIVSP